MFIPESFPQFPEPTLIVASDTRNAVFFLASGETLEPAGSIMLPPETKSDNEGSFVGTGLRTGNPSGDINDGTRKRQFAKLVAEHLRSSEGTFKHLRIAAPPEILHLVESELPGNIAERIRVKLGKDLIKESPLEILKKLEVKP